LINHFFPEPLSGNELRILQHLNPMSTAICGFFGEKNPKEPQTLKKHLLNRNPGKLALADLKDHGSANGQ